ncbi:MAG: acyl carrier protein [Candidatus Azobacteroides pseudotrichonymphae]|jgi:acyl carrier protein|uniref:Acyl carrier protein n=1 Tax=Azobacteroides pseudotrichonymphae genomovar. CFP2 TaxID=511995 RepID=ACP_AZOPC|nr:acyl carrier protein [Candidatus Azobacteroides pseudotrichonymphae]B6YR21.1 RecName: Full=Acyl carrier protein; Short=ACP [Candidatus Azobacteroides pseudotrichonymphae genomovar. CFP2]MDR0529957.1 acyl carrier protein [Bacteroidales bacterium OttesenSCG-928-I14]BAG83643.1 acyl carrier protein [Candidatus Azobacteroides pseudotrichonymphae genomovar. CFP2]GMO32206.1 MAG: acyl carrier protein [Candidatus Azobacteroides pseudotrichonymphae]
MSQISERVIDLISEKLNVEKSEVTLEADFANNLGADSLDTVELIMDLEKEFNMNPIPNDESIAIKTVGDAIAYIESHANEAATKS